MYSLLLFVLILVLSGESAQSTRTSQVIGYEMGGSQTTFSLTGLNIKKIGDLRCVIRFHDGRKPIKIVPTIPRDKQSAICRLTTGITAGSVDIDLILLSTNTVLSERALFIDPSPQAGLTVIENWNTNQLSLTWNVDYFAQYFRPGAMIMLRLYVYVADSFEPVFKASKIVQLVRQNSGSTPLTLSKANVATFSGILYPYYYVLRAVGAQPNIFQSSVIIAPTLGMVNSKAETTCLNWLNVAKVATPPKEIHPCPPSLSQVELDGNFVETEYPPEIVKATGTLMDHVLYYEKVPTQSGYAQTCSYSRSTKSLATTSPAQAGWIHYFSRQLSYMDNYFADIWPYLVCCLQSNSQDYCDLFHGKRPIDTGHTYPGPNMPFMGHGDPHIVTFESVKYDFMGHGEFWLIRGPEGSEFGVQGRMSPYDDQSVSYYIAFAARDGNTTVQIELRAGNLLVFVNERELRFSTLPVSFPLHSILLLINSDRVDVRFQRGFTITAQVQNIGSTFDIFGSGAHYNKGKGFMGIFGNFDDDPQNDLTSQDGFVIPPTEENLRDLALIHHGFGLTWLVNETESYFVYEDGKSWKDHVNVDFGPMAEYPDPATLPEEVRAACGSSLFCLYEYVGTGSLDRASEVATAEMKFDELRKEMEITVPICDILSPPTNGRVQVNGHLNGSLASYSCNKEYDLGSEDKVRTCSASEDLSQWTGVEPICIWTCKPLRENMEFVLSHDPSDCSKFFLWSSGERFLLDCPDSYFFDPKTLSCSLDYQCSGPPGC